MSRTKADALIQKYAVRSQAEVGAALGISAMRVCQIEKAALKKLRTAFEQWSAPPTASIPIPHHVLHSVLEREQDDLSDMEMQ